MLVVRPNGSVVVGLVRAPERWGFQPGELPPIRARRRNGSVACSGHSAPFARQEVQTVGLQQHPHRAVDMGDVACGCLWRYRVRRQHPTRSSSSTFSWRWRRGRPWRVPTGKYLGRSLRESETMTATSGESCRVIDEVHTAPARGLVWRPSTTAGVTTSRYDHGPCAVADFREASAMGVQAVLATPLCVGSRVSAH